MNNKYIYVVYRTINTVNNKEYIGVHRTKNINDSYLGSGKNLQLAINKFGKEKFKKEILFIFDNKKEAYLKEKELVNIKYIKRKDTYNIVTGGFGGFDNINQKGKKNTQYGTCWISNLELKISKKEKNEYLNNGWVLGRNIWKKEEKILKKKALKKKNAFKKRLYKEKYKCKVYYYLKKFINSEYRTLREFAKNECNFSHVALTKLFQKYIPNYKNFLKEGTKNAKIKLLKLYDQIKNC